MLPSASDFITTWSSTKERRVAESQSQITITGITDGTTGTWWNSSFGFRKSIAINKTKVTGALSNFPALIDITDNDLRIHVQQSNGNDIAFVNSLHTIQYDHQIELYESSTGHLVSWVRLPTLTNETQLTFYVYYGNATCENQQNPAGVWDSDFHGVWHLNESSGSLGDSTSYWNNGTVVGGVTYNVDGKIAGAMDFPGTSSGGYANIGDPVDGSLDFGDGDFSLETWVYTNEDQHRNIVSKYDFGNTGSYGYDLRINDGALRIVLVEDNGFGGTNTYTLDGATIINDNTWHYIAVVFNRSTNACFFYIDGEQDPNSPGWIGDSDTDSTNSFRLVRGPGSIKEYFGGILDEIRVSNGLRNFNWTNTSFTNQNSPSTFYTVGNQFTLYLTIRVKNIKNSNLQTDHFTILVNGTKYDCTCNRSFLFPLQTVKFYTTSSIRSGAKIIRVIAGTGVEDEYIYYGSEWEE